MPPKAKATARTQQKLVEDKTFGLKNKKGKKNQQFVAQVQASVANKFQNGKSGADRKAAKKAEQEQKEMMDSLFKPVRPSLKDLAPKKKQQEKPAEPEKKDLYSDSRDKEGTSADWDQETLERVVNEKHGKEKSQPATDKVCKFFLEAVEKGLYGWFWTCPNGGDACKYRHALPPGYVLKKDRKKKQEEEATMTLEELIDRERAEIQQRPNLTPVNPDTFAKWKAKKLAEKKKALKEANKKKKKDFMTGKNTRVSGREYFSFRPELAGTLDGDEEGDTFDDLGKENREDDIDGLSKEFFDASVFASQRQDGDDDGDGDDDDEGEDASQKKKDEASKLAIGSVSVDANVFGDLDLDDI